MRLYLDDDSTAGVLVRLLRKAGHDVLLPREADLDGEADPVHLTRAIREGRTLLSRNHDDFQDLHELVVAAGGRHPGILVIRSDNNPARDMTPRGIAAAVARLEASDLSAADQFLILNQWR